MLARALVFLKRFRNTLEILLGKLSWQYSDELAVCMFFSQREFHLPLLCHPRLAQLGADKACEGSEVGSSQHLLLFRCLAGSGWPCAVSHLPGPTGIVVSN